MSEHDEDRNDSSFELYLVMIMLVTLGLVLISQCS